ncbi:SRPBCC family protein [Cellulomonas shaoxiangyii]|uniref:SRPBCC family protein n=1 Tax=Cellulomonas shaoxiangyii TaxID=2566013 RepID=UPI001AA0789A|nr:SRPBCC family protein [Cellulomonas shaoxiangyii]
MAAATEWNVTPDERSATYRADELMAHAPGRWLRAVDVRAPAPAVFRRLCHLRAAPYSYDWVDNLGRRSPRGLLPWCEELEVGQRVMTIFTLESFVPDVEMTLVMRQGRPRTVFGDLAVTYRVEPSPCSPGDTRLVAALRVQDPPGPLPAARRAALARGDLLMMRKQLRTLGALAERDVHG